MGIKFKGKIYDESNIDKLPKNVRNSLRFRYPIEKTKDKQPEKKEEDETKNKPVK